MIVDRERTKIESRSSWIGLSINLHCPSLLTSCFFMNYDLTPTSLVILDQLDFPVELLKPHEGIVIYKANVQWFIRKEGKKL